MQRLSVYTHHFSVCPQVREKVSIFDKLCDQTEWLLESDAPQHSNHMGAMPFRHLLHHLNLRQEILALTAFSRSYVWIYKGIIH